MTSMQVFQDVTVTIEDDDGWIEGEEAARVIGYSRPRDFYRHIEENEAFLPGIQRRVEIAHQRTRNGGTREYTVVRYRLRDFHLFYLLVKSRIENANVLTQKFIQVFLEMRAYIRKQLTAPLEEALRELHQSRAIFAEEQHRLAEENDRLKALAATNVNVSGMKPGERTMVTKLVDTTGAMYLRAVNHEFGYPATGKNSRMLVTLAQELDIWGKDGFFIQVPIDIANGARIRNHAKMWLSTARASIAHKAIRRARQLGYAVPFSTLMKYGDPDAASTRPAGVLFHNGVPVLQPVKRTTKPESAK